MMIIHQSNLQIEEDTLLESIREACRKSPIGESSIQDETKYLSEVERKNSDGTLKLEISTQSCPVQRARKRRIVRWLESHRPFQSNRFLLLLISTLAKLW